TAVAGIKNRDTNQVKAEVVESVDKATLLPFMEEYIDEEAKVYTDEALVYNNIPFEHESVKHSLSEYVNEMAHTNGIESFWAMFKRGYYGTYHWMSKKHVSRYVSEFCYRHNQRNAHTIDQMGYLVSDMVGKGIKYQDLIKE
ncbi:MAG: IS1595 family transposase, partial [Flavobacteriaceae bacterium]|nr:IS1595 family transposase [Flavobacteriaceae bacterium]